MITYIMRNLNQKAFHLDYQRTVRVMQYLK